MAGGEDRQLLAGALARVGAVVAPALVLAALLTGAAQGRVVVIHGRNYGVTPTPGARMHPLAQRGAPLSRRATPLTVGGPQPQLEYGGGPLMLSPKLYLIFWGPEGSFPESYTAPIVQYAKDLQADEALTKDEFSVTELYANAAKEHITGKVAFGGEAFDTTPYPALDKANGCMIAPCVSDSQIKTEIGNEIEAQGWPTDAPGTPEAQYLLYTPEGVANCIEANVCTFSLEEGFCAYHSQITGLTGGHIATYSDLPDMSVCDSGQAPSGVAGNKDADGTLDSEIHEIVESATDPAGTGWLDEEGEEIADKCTFPLVEEQPEIYGTPLGGNLSAFTAFNQLIGGHSYYTQQIWSNASTQTPAPSGPAGCVARIGPTPSFTAPAGGVMGAAIDFNASSSYDISQPLTTYAWNYGDGSAVDTASGASSKHTYNVPGTYQVTLTVSDASGQANASTQTLPITITGAAIGPPTASIASPAGNQTYTLDQVVASSFSCAEASGGAGIASCTDPNGTTSPGALNTATAGPHSYTVTALSLDGQSAQATIQYTVAGPSANSGGESPSGGGTPGSGSSSPTGSTPGTARPVGAKPAALTNAQKLARALKACRKLSKKKRTRCIAAAKRRFTPAKHRRGKTKRR